MSKKKVLILHATAGSGHTKAAGAIYKAFGRMNHDLDVKIVNTLDYMTAFFKWSYPRIYVFLVNRIPLIWGFFYYILDNKFFYPLVSWIRHITNWMHSRRLARFLEEYRADAIITTHFLAPDVISMAGKERIKSRLVSVVTDYRLHSFWLAGGVDTYVVCYDQTREDLIRRGISPDKIKVLGMPVDALFSKSLDSDRILKRLNVEKGLFTVLVGSGGFGIGPIAELIEELMGIDIPLQLLVVCGKNKSLFSAVKNMEARANFRLVTFGFVDNMHELMEISDLIVTKSGGVVSAEALTKDLPIVGIFPIPGQESRNLDVLVSNGVGVKLEKDSDIKLILKDFYKNKNKLDEIRETIASVKKPDAATDIAKLAVNILEKE